MSYVGFLIGPVYVGRWADAVGLRGAMVAVAALAVGLFVLAPVLLRLSGFGARGPGGDVRRADSQNGDSRKGDARNGDVRDGEAAHHCRRRQGAG